MEQVPKNELPASELSPEEIANMEKSRTISDSRFLKKYGANYSINEKGEKDNLLIPREQYPYLEDEINNLIEKENEGWFLKERAENVKDMISKLEIKKGSRVGVIISPSNNKHKRPDEIFTGVFKGIDLKSGNLTLENVETEDGNGTYKDKFLAVDIKHIFLDNKKSEEYPFDEPKYDDVE